MGTTARGYAYPGPLDEPNIAQHFQALAEDIDADVEALEATIGGGGGGGDIGTVVGGRWHANAVAQAIPATVSGPGTVVAFGTNGTDPAPSGVTRTTEGSGHKFELGSSGLWHAAATIRVASTATAGEMSAIIRYGPTTFDTVLAGDGARREGLARMMNPGSSRYLPSGTKIVVHVYNGTGSGRTLEPNAGNWVQLDLWKVG